MIIIKIGHQREKINLKEIQRFKFMAIKMKKHLYINLILEEVQCQQLNKVEDKEPLTHPIFKITKTDR
mgnify:CR=1 FL=1